MVAEFLPGDQSTLYTSPWAGGNFSLITSTDERSMKFDKFTYTNLHRIQELLGGPECGLDMLPSTEMFEQELDHAKLDSISQYLKEYRPMTKEEMPEGVVSGVKFLTWNFNCPLFLANFQKHLAAIGVTFERSKIDHISSVFSPSVDAVFNCTGIGAASLGGVKDENVFPTRGQVVVVRAPHIRENRFRWRPDSDTYVIPRPFSDGSIVMGGFFQEGNWSGNTYGYETEDILKRGLELYPEIGKRNELKIIREAAGLRPSRKGGVRIEVEHFDQVNGKDRYIVHNYGASGYGYQSGLGMANEATDMYFEAAK